MTSCIIRTLLVLTIYLCCPSRDAYWAECVIISKPLVYPDDFLHIHEDVRMHEAVSQCLESRYGHLQLRPGRYTWHNCEKYAIGMLPDGPARLVFVVDMKVFVSV